MQAVSAQLPEWTYQLLPGNYDDSVLHGWLVKVWSFHLTLTNILMSKCENVRFVHYEKKLLPGNSFDKKLDWQYLSFFFEMRGNEREWEREVYTNYTKINLLSVLCSVTAVHIVRDTTNNYNSKEDSRVPVLAVWNAPSPRGLGCFTTALCYTGEQ